MSQKLPVNSFEWTEDSFQSNEDFIKNYNEEIDKGYLLEVDVQYLEKVHDLHNHLPFLPDRMKTEKVEKLVSNLHDKTEYVIHIKKLKQELNHGLVLKNVHRVIKVNQNSWLKRYFQKYFFKLMNNAVFGKTMENVPQQKEEGTIWCQNQIVILQSFSQKIY